MPEQSKYAARVVDEADVDPVLDERIKHNLATCFSHRKETLLVSRHHNGNVPDFTAVVEIDDKAAAHVAIISRTITVGETQLHVAALGLVAVLPEFRGNDLSFIAIKAAMEEMTRRDYDLGLLFCVEGLVPFYQRSGWTQISGREFKFFDLEQNKVAVFPAERKRMFFPIKLKEFPEGNVNLNGVKW